MRELDEEAGDVHHAVVFVQHHHAARSHDGAELRQRLVIHRGIEHFARDAAAGRSAGLHRFDGAVLQPAAAHIVNEARERRSQGHFHQPGIGDLAYQREDLGARAFGAARLGEPGGTFQHDGGDVVPGLDIINIGWLAEQAFVGWKRRTGPRPAGQTFERRDQRRFLSADERARAFHHLDIEIEGPAEKVATEHAIVARLLDGIGQPLHRQRILGAHINDALRSARHIPRDDHSLQQGVGIAFDLVAVHVGARVAFVGIADDVFRCALRFGEELPLQAGGVTGAAAAS